MYTYQQALETLPDGEKPSLLMGNGFLKRGLQQFLIIIVFSTNLILANMTN